MEVELTVLGDANRERGADPTPCEFVSIQGWVRPEAVRRGSVDHLGAKRTRWCQ